MDYKQPKFYHFNEDSFLLISEVIKDNPHKNETLLDVGAGCGVIGIELAKELNVVKACFLEKQEAFLESLEYNSNHLHNIKTKIIHQSIEDLKVDQFYDIIVSNPPYFKAGHGRISPVKEKQISRTFSNQMELKTWIQACLNHLKSEGVIYIICHQDSFESLNSFNYKILNERGEIKILKVFNV